MEVKKDLKKSLFAMFLKQELEVECWEGLSSREYLPQSIPFLLDTLTCIPRQGIPQRKVNLLFTVCGNSSENEKRKEW